MVRILDASSSDVHVINTKFESDSVTFVERKGIGHPDTLADNLAEYLSSTYSRYTLDKFGAILHHNFDKLGILGGKSLVKFGSGKMIAPIRVLINGRISDKFGTEDIPYKELLSSSTHDFIHRRFGELIPDDMISIVFNISTASSPGHSDKNEKSGSSRNYWFQPRGLEDLPEIKSLFSNDTSIGCGYYPLKNIESYVLRLENDLTQGEFSKKYQWAGTDVKIMGSEIEGKIEVTLCVPQISRYVSDLDEYIVNIGLVKDYLARHSIKHLGKKINFNLNTRDDYEKQELYLTATGSSIESGDEGLVGRGNRVNQLITINSPMSMEGASGKNPVYHIGKLYYIAAHQIAKKIYDEFDELKNEVYLVSNSGRALISPWKTVIKVSEDSGADVSKLKTFVTKCLDEIPLITHDLVSSKSQLVIS